MLNSESDLRAVPPSQPLDLRLSSPEHQSQQQDGHHYDLGQEQQQQQQPQAQQLQHHQLQYSIAGRQPQWVDGQSVPTFSLHGPEGSFVDSSDPLFQQESMTEAMDPGVQHLSDQPFFFTAGATDQYSNDCATPILSLSSTATRPISISDIRFPNEPRKKHKIATSCNRCRQHKRKCDGGVPCSTCKRVNADCNYTDAQLLRAQWGDSPLSREKVQGAVATRILRTSLKKRGKSLLSGANKGSASQRLLAPTPLPLQMSLLPNSTAIETLHPDLSDTVDSSNNNVYNCSVGIGLSKRSQQSLDHVIGSHSEQMAETTKALQCMPSFATPVLLRPEVTLTGTDFKDPFHANAEYLPQPLRRAYMEGLVTGPFDTITPTHHTQTDYITPWLQQPQQIFNAENPDNLQLETPTVDTLTLSLGQPPPSGPGGGQDRDLQKKWFANSAHKICTKLSKTLLHHIELMLDRYPERCTLQIKVMHALTLCMRIACKNSKPNMTSPADQQEARAQLMMCSDLFRRWAMLPEPLIVRGHPGETDAQHIDTVEKNFREMLVTTMCDSDGESNGESNENNEGNQEPELQGLGHGDLDHRDEVVSQLEMVQDRISLPEQLFGHGEDETFDFEFPFSSTEL